jgi:hypothetical protein
LTATAGFWNSINGADLDNDGDIDYVLGNYGTNSLVRATAEYPAKIYSKDFDNNGSYDFIPSVFFKDKNDQLVETPYHVKGDLIKELNGIRKSFVFYHQMANAPIDSIITKSMQKDALISQVNYLKTAILINLGNGKFELKSLPALAQIAPTKGTMIDDLDGDGNMDIVLVGNNYGSELGIGRMDAGFGLVLKGDGKNNFKPMDIATSGWMMRSDARALARLAHNGTSSLVCTNQNGPIKSYKKSSAEKLIFPQNGETKVIFKDANGKMVKTSEIYLGNGYLSQSSKSVTVPKIATQAIFYGIKNVQRTVQIDQ